MIKNQKFNFNASAFPLINELSTLFLEIELPSTRRPLQSTRLRTLGTNLLFFFFFFFFLKQSEPRGWGPHEGGPPKRLPVRSVPEKHDKMCNRKNDSFYLFYCNRKGNTRCVKLSVCAGYEN